MVEKSAEQMRNEKYADDAVAASYKIIKKEVKEEFAIKLVEGIVFAFCAAILAGFVGFLLYTIGWKQ